MQVCPPPNRKKLVIKSFEINQVIKGMEGQFPSGIWYKDIGGKSSYIEITVQLIDENGKQVIPPSGKTIKLGLTCKYESERIVSDPGRLIAIEKKSSWLQINEIGAARICLRFTDISKNNFNERFVVHIYAPEDDNIMPVDCPPVEVLSKPSRKRVREGNFETTRKPSDILIPMTVYNQSPTLNYSLPPADIVKVKSDSDLTTGLPLLQQHISDISVTDLEVINAIKSKLESLKWKVMCYEKCNDAKLRPIYGMAATDPNIVIDDIRTMAKLFVANHSHPEI